MGHLSYISSHETSLIYDHEDHTNQYENSHKLCNEMRHPVVKLMESETATSEFPNGGKAVVEQILASQEINKSKRARL